MNNRKILNGFYAMQGLADKSRRHHAHRGQAGQDRRRQGARAAGGGLRRQRRGQADEILKFIAIRGTNAEVLAALEGYRGKNEVFDAGLDELNTVTKYLAAFGVPEDNFAVDLTIARGLDYYTGTVYETTLLDHPEIGSRLLRRPL